jgi:large subunit ribosomal protein L4
MKALTYSATGKKLTAITLPKGFGEKANPALLAQAIRVYEGQAHPGEAKAKTRSEVSRTTRKWYRQKGTGRARHGARSAPIFVGGGQAHGPTGVSRALTLPDKMKQKALKVALGLKLKDNQLVVVSGLAEIKKTKEANQLVGKISDGARRLTLALSGKTKTVARAFRNLAQVRVVRYQDLNARDVFYGGLLVVDKEALK